MTVSAVNLIEETLKEYPDVTYERQENHLVAHPKAPSGFPVEYFFDGTKHIVSFLGWHEECDDQQKARACFLFGLSKKCRLQVWKRGGCQYKWIMEFQDESGTWKGDSVTGLLFFPFWLKKEVFFLQNDLI
ncbi:MAG: hypothetical protein ACAH83_19605 [Alphaproteobacteria bacterium]